MINLINICLEKYYEIKRAVEHRNPNCIRTFRGEICSYCFVPRIMIWKEQRSCRSTLSSAYTKLCGHPVIHISCGLSPPERAPARPLPSPARAPAPIACTSLHARRSPIRHFRPRFIGADHNQPMTGRHRISARRHSERNRHHRTAAGSNRACAHGWSS